MEIAHTAEELRRLLRQQGIAAAKEVGLTEGLDGKYDAAILFPDPANIVRGAGFSTSEVPLDTAHSVIRELTVLVPQPTRTLGPRKVTFYYEERR